MDSKKKLKMFPWMDNINSLVYKSCFSKNSSRHEEMFHHLYCQASSEISNILEEENFKRAKKLCDVLSAYIFSFHMNNITFYKEPEVPKKSFIMLLSCLVDLRIFLCRGDSSSMHLQSCIKDMFLLTGSHIYSLWDILLCCRLLKKIHSVIVIPIMNRVMQQLPEAIGDPAVYMKMILLMRYWKGFSISKEDKQEVLSFAYKVKPPEDFINWLSTLHIVNMPELPELKDEMIPKHFLCRAFPKGFFRKMKKLLNKSIADPSPEFAFFVDKRESDAREDSSEAEDFLINTSGLVNFEESFEEPELSEAETKDKKKFKISKDAPLEIPSEGFVVDSFKPNSAEERHLKEPDIPIIAAKKKKKSKKKQTESRNFTDNAHSEKLCDVEQTDVMMTDDTTNRIHSSVDENVIASQNNYSGSPRSLAVGETTKTRKSRKKSKKNNGTSENQFEVEAAIEKCARDESLLDSGIHKDADLDKNSDGVSTETVKRQKKKRKTVAQEVNPLEDKNKVNEDVPLGNTVLPGEPDISVNPPRKRIKKAKRLLAKDSNMLVGLEDASSEVTSVVHVGHEMQNTEVVSEIENRVCGNVKDVFNLESVSSPVASSKKKNKKKKNHSSHMSTEGFNPSPNLQTEIDSSVVAEESKMEEEKCGTSQLVSESDKDRKHKLKKKKCVSDASSVVEVTPQKILDESGDNETYQKDKISPGNVCDFKTEENVADFATGTNEAEAKLVAFPERNSVKKMRLITVSEDLNCTVSEVPKKKLDEHSSHASNLDDKDELCEKNESSPMTDVKGLQNVNTEVTPSVKISSKKKVKSNKIKCEDYEEQRLSSFLCYSPKEKNVSPSKEQTSFENSEDHPHAFTSVSSSFTENSQNTPRKKLKSKVQGSVNDESVDACGSVEKQDNFMSEHSPTDASQSESKSSRKRKKSGREFFKIADGNESFASIERNKNDSVCDIGNVSANDVQDVDMKNEILLNCNNETPDVGLDPLGVETKHKKRKSDLFDLNKSLNSIKIQNEEKLPLVCNEIPSAEVLEINEEISDFHERSEVLSVTPSGGKPLEENEQCMPHSDETKMSNDDDGNSTHRENDLSGHDESFHNISVPCVKEGNKISGEERKVITDNSEVTDRFDLGEKSEETGQADIKISHSSLTESLCDATESSDTSDNEFQEKSLSFRISGSRKKELPKTEIVSESDSSSECEASNFPSSTHAASPNRSNLSFEATSSQTQFSMLRNSTELIDLCNKSSHNKKRDSSDSLLRVSDSVKSPKKKSNSSSPVCTNTDDPSSLQKTPSTAEIVHVIKPDVKKLFSDSSSDSDSKFICPLASRIQKRSKSSGHKSGILNKSANEKSQFVTSEVKESPEKDFILLISSSDDDDDDESSRVSQRSPKKSDQPQTPSDSLFSQYAGESKSCEDEEKSASVVLDSRKDNVADVSVIDLLASRKDEKESLVPVLCDVNATNIQSSCERAAPFIVKVSGHQETNESLSSTGEGEDKTGLCEVTKTPTKIASNCNNDTSCEQASTVGRVQISPVKKHLQKSETTDGECAFEVSIGHSPDEHKFSKQQTSQSGKKLVSKTSSQDKVIFSSAMLLNSSDDSDMCTNDNNNCSLNGFIEIAKSPELISQLEAMAQEKRSNSQKQSNHADSSDSDSGNGAMKCAKNSISILETCEKNSPVRSSGIKGKPSAGKESNVLSPSDTISSPTEFSQSSSKVNSSLSKKTSELSPCEQSSSTSLCIREEETLSASPVSHQTSSGPQSIDDSPAKKKSISVETSINYCDTPALRRSSRVKHERLHLFPKEKLSTDNKKNISLETSLLQTPKASGKRDSDAASLRHSSRIKWEQITPFPGKRLSSAKKKSPLKVCLSESSSMMNVKNHLDFSDLKTSPRLKNEESETETTKDLDDVKSTKSSTGVKINSPPPPSPWKFRLRSPVEAEREKSPASSASSINPSETVDDCFSNSGDPESPVWKTASKSGLFSTEPKRYSRIKRFSSNGTSVIGQSLEQLCLTTPSANVVLCPVKLSARTPNHASLADNVSEDPIKSPNRTETDDDDAIPPTAETPTRARHMVKKNPFSGIVSSSCSKMKTKRNIFETAEKNEEELISSSCSKVRTTRSSIFGTSENDKEGYNLRPRKSLIMPPKLNVN